MTVSTQFIVLHYTKFKDNSIVLHTIGREYGRRSFLVRVGKGCSMSAFLPLNIIDAEVYENPHSELWRTGNITVAHPLSGIRGNMFKNTMTLFMSEVLYRAVRDGDGCEGFYDWCVRSILTLDSLPGDFSNFHLRFLLELAAVMGFAPTSEDLFPFSDGYRSSICALAESSFAESMLIPLSGKDRNEIADILLKYISCHSESVLDIRSLKVLRELYGN